ncbi:AbrB/MazE/SpoVT family DNA-binding domain-containing protein [Thermoplasmatales archaeon AK]|nr:AbrB/MazE/SpoVT family DNA-binding domain-containing protein [Thermoplasmatales archaeon AK]
MGRELIDVAHVSRNGASYTITIPRKVVEAMGISPGSMVAFYEEDGRIIFRKI